MPSSSAFPQVSSPDKSIRSHQSVGNISWPSPPKVKRDDPFVSTGSGRPNSTGHNQKDGHALQANLAVVDSSSSTVTLSPVSSVTAKSARNFWQQKINQTPSNNSSSNLRTEQPKSRTFQKQQVPAAPQQGTQQHPKTRVMSWGKTNLKVNEESTMGNGQERSIQSEQCSTVSNSVPVDSSVSVSASPRVLQTSSQSGGHSTGQPRPPNVALHDQVSSVSHTTKDEEEEEVSRAHLHDSIFTQSRFKKQNANVVDNAPKNNSKDNNGSDSHHTPNIRAGIVKQSIVQSRIQGLYQQSSRFHTNSAEQPSAATTRSSPRMEMTRSSKYYRKDDTQSSPEHIAAASSPPPPDIVPTTTTPSTCVEENGAMGEMQIKLDIAEAKLLTQEMKHKDLQEQLQLLKESSSEKIKELEQQVTTFQKKNEQPQHSQNQKQQQQEIEELYLEIERLHESHRAEREVVYHEKTSLVQQIQDRDEMIRKLNVELEKLRSINSVQMKESNKQQDETNHRFMEERKKLQETVQGQNKQIEKLQMELKTVKADMEEMSKDLKQLADETEHLEIELEAVTEDRDDLLRRSIVYQKQSQQSPPQSAKKSLSESSKQDYEAEQHHAEISRLRATLQEQESQLKLKDSKIRDLEEILGNKKSKVFDLDLSAIDVEHTSLLVEDKEARLQFEEELKVLENNCSKLNKELEDAHRMLKNVKSERDKLKECLADAMLELESQEAHGNSYDIQNSSFVQNLMEIIKEKDAEIELLSDQVAVETKFHNNAANSSAESFQEDLKNVVEWLDSSNRLNGSPSIEMMLVPAVSDKIELSVEDEAVVNEIFQRIKNMNVKLLISQSNLDKLEKGHRSDTSSTESQDYETSTEASFERDDIDSHTAQKIEIFATRYATEVINRLKIHIRSVRNEAKLYKEKNDELRSSLSEASNLIKPLNDHVSRIENERLELESKLALLNKRHAEHDKALDPVDPNKYSASKLTQTEEFDIDNTQFVKISRFDLRKKDDEIISLKMALKELETDLIQARLDHDESRLRNRHQLDLLSTPTKSNRGKDKKASQGVVQATNEEDDQKSRVVAAEVEQLRSDLVKSKKAEENLRQIVRDSSDRLTTLSTQAEILAHEKNQAETRIRELEKEKLELQEKFQHLDAPQTNGSAQELLELRSMNDVLSMDVSKLKAELKANSKERKKLKTSLTEAVGMLNALRNHVQTSEKERKKLKRHLRSFYMKNNRKFTHEASVNKESAVHPDVEHVPDPDQMENETTILNLKSHIVEMEHEIRILEERISELELSNPHGETLDIDNPTANERIEVTVLREQLMESKNAHSAAIAKLNEVGEINKEMLNDLKQTEFEAAEILKELNVLRKEYAHAMAEIDDAKYVATVTLHKLDGSGKEGTIVYDEVENVPLSDCISKLYQYAQSLTNNGFIPTNNHIDDNW